MFNIHDGFRVIKDTTDPIYYSLDKIKWRLFVSLTFSQKSLSSKVYPKSYIIKTKAKLLLNSLRGYFRIPKRKYIFYCLYEKSGSGDIHLHLLLSRKSLVNINYFYLVEFIQRRWNELNDGFDVQKDIQLVVQSKAKRLTRYLSKRKASVRTGIQDLEYYIPTSFIQEVRSFSDDQVSL